MRRVFSVTVVMMMMSVSIRLQVSRPHSAFSPVPFTPAFTGMNTPVCVWGGGGPYSFSGVLKVMLASASSAPPTVQLNQSGN